jgi:Na+/H+ antiporter NhaD/arsenite permease-like protein
VAALIFGLTYAVLAFGSSRPLRLDRAGAALVGATAMVTAGVLTPAQAVPRWTSTPWHCCSA